MKTLFTISFTVLQFLFASRAEGLTCLKCDSVPQPRFCNKVVECFDGEQCSVQKTLNEFGEHTYKLGCLSNKVCSHFRNASLSPTITCAECCASDNLCNSEGCGETGYPQERGPVCYNCPLHTNTAPCHDIEFCFIGEECKPADGSIISIVGKRYSDVHQQHSCDLCCTADICNKNCTTARINNDPCMSNPCLRGTCISKGDNFECVCSVGYSGRFCENDIDECKSQPCLHGTCSDHINRYSCTCAAGYAGINCETDIDECGSVECGNGTCIDGVGNYTCACNTGFAGRFCERKVTDCYDLYHTDSKRTDGVYTIFTWKTQDGVNVYCDMTTDGGGWTVFQYRFNGSVDFYRNFSEYENGFGNLNSEFWLGLRYIQEIASQDQTDLCIDLEAPNGTKAFEEFEAFHLTRFIWDELSIRLEACTILRRKVSVQYMKREKHLMQVSKSNSFGGRHNGSKFSTYDHDVDSASGNCAVSYHGAWWYNNCHHSNLNGRYLTPGTQDASAMVYQSFLFYLSLKSSRMMMRRR